MSPFDWQGQPSIFTTGFVSPKDQGAAVRKALERKRADPDNLLTAQQKTQREIAAKNEFTRGKTGPKKALRDNHGSKFSTPIQSKAATDKTNAIRGRRL